MQSSHSLDRLSVAFSDSRAVADAGLVLPATLATKLGLRGLFDQAIDLGEAPGRASVGVKALTLIYSALSGGDCIDDAGVLRAGRTQAVLGQEVRGAGHTGELTLRADAGFYSEKVVTTCQRKDVRFSISLPLHRSLAARIAALPETAWQPIGYVFPGAAVAEIPYTAFGRQGVPVRLIVRRVPPSPGSQLALFATYAYHGFICDREGDTLALEADHRRHAEIENVIRDLKYGVGLNHLPSGRFGANAAWLALQVMAHNLGRWLSQLAGKGRLTTKTLRTRFLSLPGRLTRSARRSSLCLPAGWPWREAFTRTLLRLRALPPPPA